MAHEIETMAYANAVPWHGLGNRVDKLVTVDEMLVAAGLDWEIKRERIYAKDENGKEIVIPNRRAMIRSSDNKVMTIAGGDWRPLQNRDMLNFFKDYCEAGGCTLETAGSLRGGSVVWGLANLNDGFAVGGNDAVRGYLLFTSPHQIGSAITVRTTTVRVVCANTMALANRNGKGQTNYSQSHIGGFKFEKAKEAVENAHEQLKQASARANALHNLKMSMDDQLKFLAKFFGQPQDLGTPELLEICNSEKESHFGQVVASLQKAPGAEAGTAWGTLNAVTHWCDHVAGRTNATRMFNSWIGERANLKLDVETELMAMAE